MILSTTKLAKTVKIVALGAGLVSSAMVAYAASPDDPIAARQAGFKQMGKGMKAIGEQLKSPAPASDAIRAAALAIDQAAAQVDGYFPKGSGPQPGVKTEALPAIWDRNAEFRADAAKLVRASAALRVAADSGDSDAVKTQFLAVGGACKECHQNYRARDN